MKCVSTECMNLSCTAVGQFVWGPAFTRDIAHDMLVEMDVNQDGKISREE
jgi:Ca2+-binding EF-hand superfamily protein